MACLPRRTRSTGTVSLLTTGRSSYRVTTCSSPDRTSSPNRTRSDTSAPISGRVPLQTDLFALHRHGDLLVLGDDVLAQPDTGVRLRLGPYPQLLVGTGHG